MNIRKLYNKTSIAFFVLYFLVISVIKTMASGWAVDSYSAKSLSTSNASSSTDLNDVTNSSINPATISGVEKNQLSASGAYLGVTVDYETSTDSGDAGVSGFIPSISYAKKISDDINFGLSVSVPYGLTTEYKENWLGNTQGVKSEVEAKLFNPIASYDINSNLSIAFGAKFQQLSTRLTKISSTAVVKLKGEDWGYGFNSGLIYKINKDLNLGLSYSSKIEHKFKKQHLEAGPNVAQDAKFSIITPESVNFGLSYDLTEYTKLFYDLSWTRWSRIKNISTESSLLSSSSGGVDTLNLNWVDSIKNAVAIDHKLNDKYSLRGGLAYETAAVDSDREARTPTSDKYWASLGTEYKINQDSALDLAYVHQFFRSGRIPSLSAEYDIAVDIFAIGYRLNF
jgi:long-chain fatty acid transport protein